VRVSKNARLWRKVGQLEQPPLVSGVAYFFFAFFFAAFFAFFAIVPPEGALLCLSGGPA
jgi:hypothetical protein